MSARQASIRASCWWESLAAVVLSVQPEIARLVCGIPATAISSGASRKVILIDDQACALPCWLDVGSGGISSGPACESCPPGVRLMHRTMVHPASPGDTTPKQIFLLAGIASLPLTPAAVGR